MPAAKGTETPDPDWEGGWYRSTVRAQVPRSSEFSASNGERFFKTAAPKPRIRILSVVAGDDASGLVRELEARGLFPFK